MRGYFFLFIALFSFSACGDDSSPGNTNSKDGGPSSAEAGQYCEKISGFFCDFYLRCGRMAVDTKEQCLENFLESCNTSFEGGFVGLADKGYLSLSSTGIELCKEHLDTVTCEQQFFELSGPCAKMWTGYQNAGEGCGVNEEFYTCSDNTECILGLDFCGTCTPLVNIGESCTPGENTCGANGVCRNNICVARIAYGESCGEEDRCVAGAQCTDAICRGPRVVAAGDSCDRRRRCPYQTACIDALCQPSMRLGETCGPDKPCASGYCDTTCLAPKENQASCSSASQCRSGLCIKNQCKARPSACMETT